MILDTTFVIDFFKGDNQAKIMVKQLQEAGEPLFVTSITVFEIFQGLRDDRGKLLAKSFFGAVPLLVFDRRSAENAGEIQLKLRQSGELIDPEDAMIAGIALVKNQKILTKNLKHFSRVKGISIETY